MKRCSFNYSKLSTLFTVVDVLQSEENLELTEGFQFQLGVAEWNVGVPKNIPSLVCRRLYFPCALLFPLKNITIYVLQEPCLLEQPKCNR